MKAQRAPQSVQLTKQTATTDVRRQRQQLRWNVLKHRLQRFGDTRQPGFVTRIGLGIARRKPGDLASVQFFVRRSEEHTSELQSLMRISYAVFCLKKKKRQQFTTRSKQYINTTQQIHV